VNSLERERPACLDRLGQRLPADVGGDPAEDLEEPSRARVHDARLAKDVELLRRAGKGHVAVREELGKGVLDRQGRGAELLGLLGERPCDGEDRASCGFRTAA
jgi:hypothetical protein